MKRATHLPAGTLTDTLDRLLRTEQEVLVANENSREIVLIVVLIVPVVPQADQPVVRYLCPIETFVKLVDYSHLGLLAVGVQQVGAESLVEVSAIGRFAHALDPRQRVLHNDDRQDL